MIMINGHTLELYGSPLAVCVNDCEIDYGQEAPELAPVCFRVHCAFAEMRWGSLIDWNAPYVTIATDGDREKQAGSP